MKNITKWLREVSSSDSIDSLIQRCHVAANTIDAQERDLNYYKNSYTVLLEEIGRLGKLKTPTMWDLIKGWFQ